MSYESLLLVTSRIGLNLPVMHFVISRVQSLTQLKSFSQPNKQSRWFSSHSIAQISFKLWTLNWKLLVDTRTSELSDDYRPLWGLLQKFYSLTISFSFVLKIQILAVHWNYYRNHYFYYHFFFWDSQQEWPKYLPKKSAPSRPYICYRGGPIMSANFFTSGSKYECKLDHRRVHIWVQTS